MIVCICRRISDSQIARHARAGMGFGDIQFELGVATQCGKCEGCARDVVAQCSASAPVSNIQLADNLPGGSTATTSSAAQRFAACQCHFAAATRRLGSAVNGRRA